MVSGSPSLLQVTVVAGEPVEVQVRLEDEDPGVNARLEMLGGAEREKKSKTSKKYHYKNNIIIFMLVAINIIVLSAVYMHSIHSPILTTTATDFLILCPMLLQKGVITCIKLIDILDQASTQCPCRIIFSTLQST